MATIYENTIRHLLNATNEEIIRFFNQKRILKSSLNCISCSVELSMKKSTANIDGYVYRCYSRQCSFYQKRVSIRTNSFLSVSKISLKNWVEVLFRWSQGDLIERVMRDISISQPTLIKIYKLIRNEIKKFFSLNPVRLGGENIICQVDESLFCHKPKYHRGRASEVQVWVFGIADTNYVPARCFLKVVPNRRATTLLPIINDVCLPNTIIFSDEWAAYQRISEGSYIHDTVNHTLVFVDPESGVHTQNIESCWSSIKRKFKYMKGVHKTHLQSYLNEFMWRQNSTEDIFERLLFLISNYVI